MTPPFDLAFPVHDLSAARTGSGLSGRPQQRIEFKAFQEPGRIFAK